MTKFINQVLPKDEDGFVVAEVPAIAPFSVQIMSALDNAVDVTLDADTSFIEVNALAKGVLMRYQATASTASFDEFIPQDATRRYAVPDGTTVLSFIEIESAATAVLIEK